MGRVAGRVLFAAIFITGGLGHFMAPNAYVRIVPPSLPEARALVLISGVVEILLGILLLLPPTRIAAAWGLIALLVAVFPANVYMWRHADQFSIPAWALLARLPLQGLLIAWAWAYTRAARKDCLRPAGGTILAPLMALGLACGLAGCDLGAARLDRLPDGSMARTKSPTGQAIPVFFAASEETVAEGTQVRVVSDGEGTVHQVDRKVIVGFATGAHQGLAAMMRRSDLIPDR